MAMGWVLEGKLPCEMRYGYFCFPSFFQNTVNFSHGKVMVNQMLQAVTHQNLVHCFRLERPGVLVQIMHEVDMGSTGILVHVEIPFLRFSP